MFPHWCYFCEEYFGMFTELFTCCLFYVQYLSCLSSSQSSTDKLAFDVGLQEDKTGIYLNDQLKYFLC